MFHVEHFDMDACLLTFTSILQPFACTDIQLQLMVQHWQLVKTWNARSNLTAIVADKQAAWLHYYDSLAALLRLQDGPVVDFGSGAGFPGVPLAIMRPQWQFTLVEPRRKRVSFLELACARLGLTNVRVLMGRLEDKLDISTQHQYTHAVTRATFSDKNLLQAASSWLKPQGTLLIYCSVHAAQQADAYTYTLHIPNAPAARSIDIISF